MFASALRECLVSVGTRRGRPSPLELELSLVVSCSVSAPEALSNLSSHLLFDRDAKMQTGQKMVSSAKAPGKTDSYNRGMRVGPFLSPCTKINPRWIKHPNIKIQKIKTLVGKGGGGIQDTSWSEDFMTGLGHLGNKVSGTS